jgi:large subunit ribosomal protein L17
MSDARRAKILRSRSGRRYRHGQAKAGQSFTAMSVVHHLINNVAPRFDDRAGGYTRVIRLGSCTKGDSSSQAILQLIGEEESPGTVTRPEKTARQRRTERRYAFAAKAVKQTKPTAEPAATEPEPEVAAEPEAEAPGETEPEASAEDKPSDPAAAPGDEQSKDKADQ